MINYKERTDVPAQEKWDLSHIYPGIEAWENDLKKLEASAKQLKSFDGAIEDGNSLLHFLQLQENVSKMLTKVYAYARLWNDSDTRDSESQVRLKKAESVSYRISEATSFFSPFLLSLDESVLKTYISSNEGLRYFEEDLFEMYRFKKHVLNKDQEEILSFMSEALS